MNSYSSVIRMQASVMRGEVINIGVLVYDANTKDIQLTILPVTHPKIQSVVLPEMRPDVYSDLVNYFTEAVHKLVADDISLFEEDLEKHPELHALQFLREQGLITMSKPSVIRTAADHNMVHGVNMKVYVT